MTDDFTIIADGGNAIFSTPATNGGYTDLTRWSNFYGGGGWYGGLNHTTTVVSNVANPITTSGYDALLIPSAVNLLQNSQNLFQQDLSSRAQLWEQLVKVWPEVSKSSYFNTYNFPGLRTILAINTQVPSIRDSFISGTRALDGNSMIYLKLNYTPNPLNGTSTAKTGFSMASGSALHCWIEFDRIVRVDLETGLTGVDN